MLGIVAAIIVFIILSSKISNLSREIDILKGSRGVAPVQTQAQTNPVPTSTGGVNSLGLQQNRLTQSESIFVAPPNQVFYQQPQESKFVAWVKDDFFVKLGAFLLLIGFGWFVSYAFAHQWIGEVGRITLGLLTGILIMVLGVWRIRTYLHQGSIFLVLGSSTVLLTIFAARELYNFFTPTSALTLMFLCVTFVALVSVKYKNEPLALASLILACIAPFFTNVPAPDIAGLFTYLLIVVVGTLWVVYKTGSHTLTFSALLLVILYSMPFFGDSFSPGERDIALFFAFIFTALFFGANVISIIHKRTEGESKKSIQAHVATAFATGMFLIAWILTAVPDELQSLVCAVWMLVFGVGSFVVYRFSENRIPFYIYSGVSVVLLGVATATELQGPALTVAFSLEVGLLVLLTRLLTNNPRLVLKASTLFVLPVTLSLMSMSSRAWNSGFLHGDFFVLVVLASMFLVISASLIKRNERNEESSMDMALGFGVAGVVYILIIVWLVLHSIMSDDVATTISLLIYSIVGLSMFIKGRMEEERTTSIAGGLLLGFVVAHLFLIDIWQMELVGRIVTFVAVGTLLISTAFLGQKKKHEQI